MAFRAWLVISVTILIVLPSRLAIALVFAPTSTLFRPSRLGIQAYLNPASGCPTTNRYLDPRQDSQSTLLATCGWVGGNPEIPVTCGVSLYCATTSTFVGCCEPSSCIGIFTTCYDLFGADCNVACQNNPQNLVCPTSLPYCALYNYAHGSVGYGCAEYSGYTTTVLLYPITTALGTLTEPTSSPTSTSSTYSATSATSSAIAAPSHSASNGLGSGVIAGISVGGSVVVVAICYLIFLIWSHKLKSTQTARQSYISSTAFSRTLHPSGLYSGTKFFFPSPQSPPWYWGSSDQHSPGLVEMPAESGTRHELHGISR